MTPLVVALCRSRLALWQRLLQGASATLSAVCHHGVSRPRWTGHWGAGAIRKRFTSVARLPVALQRVLKADVVLASYSAVVAEEWAPGGCDCSASSASDKENQATAKARVFPGDDESVVHVCVRECCLVAGSLRASTVSSN